MDTQTNLFVDFVFSFGLRPASPLKTVKFSVYVMLVFTLVTTCMGDFICILHFYIVGTQQNCLIETKTHA